MADRNGNSIYLGGVGAKTTIGTRDPGTAHGTWYLTQNPAHYEPQRANNFTFYVNFEPGFISNDAVLKQINNYALTDANDVLKISVDSTFVPHFSNAPLQLKRGNNTMKFAGVPEFRSGTIKVTDFIGAGTKDLLMAWQRKVYDPETEKVGLASDYKHDAFLIELTPDYQVVRTWKLYGCWISGLQEDDYDHTNNSLKKITISIEYDLAKVDVSDIDTTLSNED